MRISKRIWLALSIVAVLQIVFSGCKSPETTPPAPITQPPIATITVAPSPPTVTSPQTQPTQVTPQTPQTQQTPVAQPTPQATPTRREFQVEVIARNLEVPWSIAYPHGLLFRFTERPGRISALELEKPPRLLATIEVARISESGLLGIAIPSFEQFEQDHFLYIYYTYREGSILKNRVVRFTEQGGKAINPFVLLDNIPGAGIHDGGRLRFGPDRKLYITAGDAANSELAQDPRSLAGKILRLNPDGSIPADNPFPGSPVYSLGHRNPQGLDWHPVTGQLFAVEHGPSAHDELNLIVPGGNFGWPRITGKGNDPRFLNPLLESGTDTWAPSGASFYRGSRLAGWENSFFFAALRGTALHRVTFKGPGLKEIDVHEVLLKGAYGRLRDVVDGPDGFLYIATNNRDGRGSPIAEDDRILRIVASGN